MMNNKAFIIAASFLIIAMVIAQEKEWIPQRGGAPVGISGSVTSSGVADIGGPFTLTSHTGETVSNTDFAGEYMLVFFGFTNCPAVCPTGLQTMTTVLNELPESIAEQVQPVFITIDVERDTPENIKLYLENFHPKIVGLWGEQGEIDAVLKSYRAYAKKVETEMMGTMFDHSSYVYLMSPDGAYIKHFMHNTPAPEVVESLVEIIG